MATGSDPAEWLDLYGDVLYRFALLRVRDSATAEDLVQETLIAAMKGRQDFRGQSGERTWLIGILKNKVVDHLRRAHREVALGGHEDILTDADADAFDATGHWQVDIAAWSAPERDLESTQFWRVLQACIEAMPPGMSRLFVLREVDGMSAEEIRDLEGISSVNNVWTMLSRARMRVRGCMQENWFGAMG